MWAGLEGAGDQGAAHARRALQLLPVEYEAADPNGRGSPAAAVIAARMVAIGKAASPPMLVITSVLGPSAAKPLPMSQGAMSHRAD